MDKPLAKQGGTANTNALAGYPIIVGGLRGRFCWGSKAVQIAFTDGTAGRSLSRPAGEVRILPLAQKKRIFMNMKEISKNIAREFSDAIKGIDSNPEHIASFPAHLAGCSLTKPLIINSDLRPLPSQGTSDAGWTTESVTISCSECGGSVTTK